MEPSNALTSTQLSDFISGNGISAKILPMDGHTPTVEDAARELGVETDQIIKSLVFMANGDPVMVINNGTARVDRKKLADILGVSRRKVKFADTQTVTDITGFIVGSMPPFGHRKKLRTLVDAAVPKLDIVYGGGGDIDAMMRLTTEELLRVTAAEVVEISE